MLFGVCLNGNLLRFLCRGRRHNDVVIAIDSLQDVLILHFQHGKAKLIGLIRLEVEHRVTAPGPYPIRLRAVVVRYTILGDVTHAGKCRIQRCRRIRRQRGSNRGPMNCATDFRLTGGDVCSIVSHCYSPSS